MLRFIFGKYIIMLTSYFIKVILVLGGMKIGKGFRVDGFPRIIGKKTNITIGDNVSIMKGVELKTRGGGEIQILNNVPRFSCYHVI